MACHIIFITKKDISQNIYPYYMWCTIFSISLFPNVPHTTVNLLVLQFKQRERGEKWTRQSLGLSVETKPAWGRRQKPQSQLCLKTHNHMFAVKLEHAHDVCALLIHHGRPLQCFHPRHRSASASCVWAWICAQVGTLGTTLHQENRLKINPCTPPPPQP